MKIIVRFFLIIFLLLSSAVAWQIFGPTISEPSEKYFYISTGSSIADVKQTLIEKKILSNTILFDLVSERLKFKKIKPGRYNISNSSSLIKLIRILRNGNQTPVKLVISKLRTNADFAKLINKHFETDSLAMIHFLDNKNGALHNYKLNSESVLTAVFPDTYHLNWNSTPKIIFDKLLKHSLLFWNEERKNKAAAWNLSTEQVYILASIIDEESNYSKEKSTIASVYLNRIKKRMPLQADPTIKFALQDFGLKRIYKKHLSVKSPYNTYVNLGLPPGPICTAKPQTIDAVLNAPKTEYLYFVANANFSGTHVFTSTYKEHLKKAKQYQQALNKLEKNKP